MWHMAMTANPAPVAPDWIIPGAEVLVVRGYRDESVIRTRVAKVRKRYFTVDHRAFADLRFSLDRQGRSRGGVWSSTTRVIPLDSDEARGLLETGRRRQLANRAREACDRWVHSRKRDDR